VKSAIDHFVTSELRLPSRQSLMFPQIALFDTCVYFAYVKPFTVEIIFVNISSLVQINFPRNIQFSAIKQQQSGGRNSGETTQNSSSQEAGTQGKQHKTAAVRRQELRGNNTKQQQSGGRNSEETTQNSSSQEAGTQGKQHKTFLSIYFVQWPTKCTIFSQIITLLHVSTLSYHPQGVCNQYFTKLHKYFNCSCW